MAENGERGPRIGENFRNCSLALLKRLGYRELFGGKHGLDFVAEPPHPRHIFIRPEFSPNGVTAFELTAETQLRYSKISAFKEKIQNYNNSRIGQNPEIHGGVIVADTKIPNSRIKKIQNEGIFCWDIRHLNFLIAKCLLWSEWVSEKLKKLRARANHEFLIREYSTCFKFHKPTYNYVKINLAIFHHSPYSVLSVSDTHQIISPIISPIKQTANSDGEIKKIILELHVAGEIQHGISSKFGEILAEYADDFVGFHEDLSGAFGYNNAPWHWFLVFKRTY